MTANPFMREQNAISLREIIENKNSLNHVFGLNFIFLILMMNSISLISFFDSVSLLLMHKTKYKIDT
jgi:hypothetical protein